MHAKVAKTKPTIPSATKKISDLCDTSQSVTCVANGFPGYTGRPNLQPLEKSTRDALADATGG